jgi:paraquat-inducible protein B
MRAAKPVVVGSFVLGALALGVVAILFFGGTQLFRTTVRVVVFFRESIAGLDVGAPVTFRGVRIGKVGEMTLHVDALHHTDWIPVYLDLDLHKVSWANGSVGGTPSDLEAAVKSGLRAQLVSQSLVSEQLNVNLDLHPDAPAVLAGHPEDGVEIPTIPSDMQDLKDEFRHLDLPVLGLKVQRALDSMQQVLGELQGKIGPLADGLQKTLTTTTVAVHGLQRDTSRTLSDMDRLANEGRGQIATNGKDLDQLLQTSNQAMQKADTLVASLNDLTSPRSSLRGDLQASLRDFAASADSLRHLMRDLDRNPLGTLMRREKR